MKLKISFLMTIFLFAGLVTWVTVPGSISAQAPVQTETETEEEVEEDEESQQEDPVIEDLLKRIAELQEQISKLTAQVDEQEGVIAEQEEKIMRLERILNPGDSGEEVVELQKFLNAQGYTVAEFGPGSSGNETPNFGPLTQRALIGWQRDNLGGAHAVGRVGPITMATINGMIGVDDDKEESAPDAIEDETLPDDTHPGQGQEKVTVCHVPPGNPANAKTITIAAPAVQAHLAQASYLGECEEAGDDEDDDQNGNENGNEEEDNDNDNDLASENDMSGVDTDSGIDTGDNGNGVGEQQ